MEACDGTGLLGEPSYAGISTQICPECKGDGTKTGPYDPGNDKQSIILGDQDTRADAGNWTRTASSVGSGDRLLTPEELEGIAHAAIYRKFRRWSKENVYNYEHHVKLSEGLKPNACSPPGSCCWRPSRGTRTYGPT